MLQVQQAELEPITKVFGDREQAIRSGMCMQGKRYEVIIQANPRLIPAKQQCIPDAEAYAPLWVTPEDAGMLPINRCPYSSTVQGRLQGAHILQHMLWH